MTEESSETTRREEERSNQSHGAGFGPGVGQRLIHRIHVNVTLVVIESRCFGLNERGASRLQAVFRSQVFIDGVDFVSRQHSVIHENLSDVAGENAGVAVPANIEICLSIGRMCTVSELPLQVAVEVDI